ncbi:MAG: hypothetical protein GXO48_03570 [Chlorobi bacterium]|nr:hypothetical protein [Chlorobiota bacterium]
MRQLILIGLGITLNFSGFAQTAMDALKMSRWHLWSTARGTAVGSSMGAVGADASVMLSNPAGLGLYKRGDFMFTPMIQGTFASTNYLNEVGKSSRYSFGIANVAIIDEGDNSYYKGEPKEEGWLFVNWALGGQRLADFNQRIVFSGTNSFNSMLDAFVVRMNGRKPQSADPFYEGLAYHARLLRPINADSTEYMHVAQGIPVFQRGELTERGSIFEGFLAVAGNYSNKVYIGGSVDVSTLNYKRSFLFEELDINDLATDFEKFTLSRNISTKGYGIGGRFGILYWLPIPVRIGFAMHSPRFYNLTDNYGSVIESVLDTSGSFRVESEQGKFNYKFVSPWRVTANMGIIFKRIGFISLDYAFVDYSTMYFDFGNGSGPAALESSVNTIIASRYGPSHELRGGLELKLAPWFMFRLGGGIATTPYSPSVGIDEPTVFFSGGIGVREKEFYLDFALSHVKWTEQFVPYTIPGIETPVANTNLSRTSFLITFGWRY